MSPKKGVCYHFFSVVRHGGKNLPCPGGRQWDWSWVRKVPGEGMDIHVLPGKSQGQKGLLGYSHERVARS